YGVIARQTHKNRDSNSDRRNFNVVVLAPQITQPTEGGNLPRTAKIKGCGRRGGRVEVWEVGASEPLLEDIVVNGDGEWEGEVTFAVGLRTLRARQSFIEEGKTHWSEYSAAVQYSVVPAAPFVETPVAGQHIGQRVVVSGFGVPGDTISVNGVSMVISQDRTWFLKLQVEAAEGEYLLHAVAECDGFKSQVALRRVRTLQYTPSIEQPAAGRVVSNPIALAGKGRPGIARVARWYTPDEVVAQLPVSNGKWQGWAGQSLSVGPNWLLCQMHDAAGVPVSNSLISGRFEVVIAGSGSVDASLFRAQ
ncbi:hypothetical protein ICA15_28360, partial [Pseudomonas sp. P116]|nr:hypothetical protein [Pseudomonas sp. P9(2020)]MBZ9566080.1 hypothetical protein [Pseudomonas sp. P116]